MKCTICKNPLEDDYKYLAYYSNGKPVYWKKCNKCIKDMYIKYMKEFNKDLNNDNAKT